MSRMLHDPVDDGASLIATLDLTYATTYKWAAPWASATSTREGGEEWEPEMSDPRALGFPAATADNMGLPNTLYGHPLWGFAGFFHWRAL